MKNTSSNRCKKSAPLKEVWKQGKPVKALMSSSIHANKLAEDQMASLNAPRSPYLRHVSATRVTGHQIRLGLERELVQQYWCE